MRYELFVYNKETEELIHNQQAALADLIACLIDLNYESGYEFMPFACLIDLDYESEHEFMPWVIMEKPDEGGSWERYYDRRGGLDIHYKKIMEEE